MSGLPSAKGAKAPAAAVILRRELSALFSGPVAYIVSALFLGFSGLLFFSTFFLVNRAELRGFFGVLPMLFAFFVPALTMRLLAEERRSGSIETLLTLPVSAFDVVMGKFFAVLLYIAAMLIPTLAYVVTVTVMGTPDAGPIFGGYLGALFLASAFASVGLFASAVTKNQIVAFFIAFAVSFGLVILDQFLVIFPSSIVGPLDWLSAGSHFDSISRGIVDSRDLLYFLSVTAVFLALTVKTVQERREI